MSRPAVKAAPTAAAAPAHAAKPAPSLPEDAVLALPRGVRLHHDRVRQTWVLLAPERVLKLDQVGLAVLERVDGVRSFGGIADDLAAAYAAPREQISGDAARFLCGLIARRMVDIVR